MKTVNLTVGRDAEKAFTVGELVDVLGNIDNQDCEVRVVTVRKNKEERRFSAQQRRLTNICRSGNRIILSGSSMDCKDEVFEQLFSFYNYNKEDVENGTSLC